MTDEYRCVSHPVIDGVVTAELGEAIVLERVPPPSEAERLLLAMVTADSMPYCNEGCPGCLWCGCNHDSPNAPECEWVKARAYLTARGLLTETP